MTAAIQMGVANMWLNSYATDIRNKLRSKSKNDTTVYARLPFRS